MKVMTKAELVAAVAEGDDVRAELERDLDPEGRNAVDALMVQDADDTIICRVLMAMTGKDAPTEAFLRLKPEEYRAADTDVRAW